jgi:protein tyrosine phosphatase (PTP) superfamily phosphohydrolase (DUF442 family)/cytochrome c556
MNKPIRLCHRGTHLHQMAGLFILLLLLLNLFQTVAAESLANRSTPEALPAKHLSNLFRAATNVFSGNLPTSENAFAEIASLGVKTIISVDGTKPDVATARKFGLRYIHLPLGYHEIPATRVAELASAVKSSAASIYVHCHHGLHRGPAAVALICEANAGWTTNQALAWLQQAGTSTDYSGLYRSVREFRPIDSAAVAGIRDLPEIARTSPLVESMAAIGAAFDSLQFAQKSAWSQMPAHDNTTPAQKATVLWEHFREMARAEDTATRTEDYRAKLASTEKHSNQLRALLRDSGGDAKLRDEVFRSLGQSCKACHTKYRD